MNKTPDQLTTVEFHILLALRNEALHGYQVIKQIEADSEGNIALLTGTLYNAIKRLIADELIAGTEGKIGEDSRRKYYELTEKGKKALGVELARYEAAVRLARSGQFANFSGYAH